MQSRTTAPNLLKRRPTSEGDLRDTLDDLNRNNLRAVSVQDEGGIQRGTRINRSRGVVQYWYDGAWRDLPTGDAAVRILSNRGVDISIGGEGGDGGVEYHHDLKGIKGGLPTKNHYHFQQLAHDELGHLLIGDTGAWSWTGGRYADVIYLGGNLLFDGTQGLTIGTGDSSARDTIDKTYMLFDHANTRIDFTPGDGEEVRMLQTHLTFSKPTTPAYGANRIFRAENSFLALSDLAGLKFGGFYNATAYREMITMRFSGTVAGNRFLRPEIDAVVDCGQGDMRWREGHFQYVLARGPTYPLWGVNITTDPNSPNSGVYTQVELVTGTPAEDGLGTGIAFAVDADNINGGTAYTLAALHVIVPDVSDDDGKHGQFNFDYRPLDVGNLFTAASLFHTGDWSIYGTKYGFLQDADTYIEQAANQLSLVVGGAAGVIVTTTSVHLAVGGNAVVEVTAGNVDIDQDVTLSGGATGGDPTPQLVFSNYYDSQTAVSISHLQLYTNVGFGVHSTNELALIVPRYFEIFNSGTLGQAGWKFQFDTNDGGNGSFTATGTIAGATVTGANVTSGADPGHTHTGASLSDIDIIADTNLSASSGIDLDAAANLTAVPGEIDHGGLAGLSDDDHPAYMLDAGTSVDNTLPRFNGTDGRTMQTSGIVVDDSNNVSGMGTLACGTITAGNLTLGSGSITDSSGAIDFGNENLSTSGNISATAGSLIAGVADNTQGVVLIYGRGAGQTIGGFLGIYTSADYDGVIDRYVFKTDEDDFTLTRQGETTPYDFMLDSNGDVLLGNDLILPKTAGNGIKVDTTTPTFGWRDLIGQIRTRGVGGTDPNDATYIGNVKAYNFSVGDEAWIDYHIPHDYVPGTDIHLHFHWSHTSAVVTGGTVTWGADVTYAKGHNQAPFSATVNPTVSPSASTTQYQHIFSEVQISAGTPGATQIDSDDLEPDGVIMVRVYLAANNITSSGAVPDPFLHFADIHYQSTNIGTKEKAPDFYA